jgi:ubiquinone/menaquinone biosynthesis C-methylase UbiE
MDLGCYNDFAIIYDKLLIGDIDYDEWGNFILSFCDEYGVARNSYLDIACGTGNMTLRLGKAFKETWAVDLSEEMLSIADSKLRSSGLKARVICEDMCNLELKRSFNLITCCLDSTNYLTSDSEIKDYFSAVYNHLCDNGLFVFDINSYYKISEILGSNTFNFDNDDVVYIWENSFENEIVDMYLTFFVKDGGIYRRIDENHRERAYRDEEIDRLLKDAGFKILKKLNNYENKSIKKETERITYVVTR